MARRSRSPDSQPGHREGPPAGPNVPRQHSGAGPIEAGPTTGEVEVMVTPSRRKLVWWIGGAVVLIAILAAAGPYIYIHFIEGPAPARSNSPRGTPRRPLLEPLPRPDRRLLSAGPGISEPARRPDTGSRRSCLARARSRGAHQQDLGVTDHRRHVGLEGIVHGRHGKRRERPERTKGYFDGRIMVVSRYPTATLVLRNRSPWAPSPRPAPRSSTRHRARSPCTASPPPCRSP